jgi:glycosyltransferase involved in cell wall biosynthesis
MDSSRTRILVSSEWFPPAFKAGGPIRSVYNLILAMKSDGGNPDLEFFVLAGIYDLGEEEKMAGVDEGVWSNLESLSGVQVRYENSSNWKKSNWKNIFEEVKPDVLYLNSLFSIAFALRPLKIARSNGVKTVLAPRGMLGAGALAIKPLKKFIFLSLARNLDFFQGVEFHASTKDEVLEVEMHIPGKQVFEARNFSDPTIKALPANTLTKGLKLLCLGRVHPIKNLLFALEILSKMDLNGRKVNVNIVGPSEDEKYLNSILNLSKGSLEITYSGATSHKGLQEVFKNTHFLLMPTLHENYGHAIIESWGFGRPVLLSDNTPWSDLQKLGLGYSTALIPELWEEVFNEVLAGSEDDLRDMSKRCNERYQELVFDPELLRANRAIFTSDIEQ